MKTVQYYRRKGHFKPLCIYYLFWFILCMGLYILAYYLFISNSWAEIWHEAWIFAIIAFIILLLAYLSFVKIDTTKKTLTSWLFPRFSKTINLSDVVAVHIRYSWQDLFNVILTLKDGSHLRLSIEDAKGFVEQIKAIAPGIEIDKE